MTMRATEPLVVPPVFVQDKLYVYVFTVESAPVDCVPEAALVPDQSPEAVHLVGGLVADKDMVDELPWLMVDGLTLRLMTGAAGGGGGAAVTVTVAELVPVPPALVQASVYV